jgi:Lysozyme like domain
MKHSRKRHTNHFRRRLGIGAAVMTSIAISTGASAALPVAPDATTAVATDATPIRSESSDPGIGTTTTTIAAPATPAADPSAVSPDAAPGTATVPEQSVAPVPGPLATSHAPDVAPESPPDPPVVDAAPEPAARPAPRGGGSVSDAIATYFGDVYDSAIGVARCESGLNPDAIGSGGRYYGLFQISSIHAGRAEALGYSWDQILDPYVNAAVARSIYDGAGWRPWGCRWAA